MDKTLKEKKKVAVNLDATIRMGKSGVTQALIDEIKAQIKKKDAVKVKLLGTRREETKAIASELAERCNAELIDVRGNTVV
ncbi:MAG: YhbY family RNA-binding protein, partial [Thermoplasmata archaeon]|nr:YhbY family RNA-binding protein [Thermoplasmata archaeon]